MNDAVLASTKHKNKWTVSIFAEWQRLREVKVPVLVCGGLFKDYVIWRRKMDPKLEILWAELLEAWLALTIS